MDDRQLQDMLAHEEIPPVDENARKRAINLALAEFDTTQRHKQNSRQGFPLLSRLTGRSNAKARRRPMHKRFVFGGMATATAIIVGIGTYGILDGYRPAPQDQLAQQSAGTRNETRSEAEADQQPLGALSAVPPASTPPAAAPALADAKTKPTTLLAEESLGANMADSSSSDLRRTRALQSQPAIEAPQPKQYQDVGRDQFADVEQNTIARVTDAPVSTFSIDVDTASYSFVRRMLNGGTLPQPDAVRVEELINYFDYDYAQATTTEQPFEPTITVLPSPWNNGNKLIHIGIKGYDSEPAENPRSNLVFLLDVSGSMNAPDKLPLVISAMKLLLNTLNPDDTVAIVVYAGAAGTVLEPTAVADKAKILAALDRLDAGGSTAGAEGIRQAYALAEGNLDEDAVNRVILATDGDFNVGITNPEELEGFVARKRQSGVFLSILGFGQGNLNDRLMQTLAQNGNGVAAYIDTLNEARKVLVEEAASTLFPIAKDVKIQVEFNPQTVSEYRLIGYETRALNREDFANDNVDAGDIGAGHTVTAIYEITPVGVAGAIGETRYPQAETAAAPVTSDFADEYAFLKFRYKLPNADTSQLISTPITTAEELTDENGDPQQLREARWATAVAAFGQILKGGKYTGDYTYEDVIALARAAKGDDKFGYRAEFINLVRLAGSASALPK